MASPMTDVWIAHPYQQISKIVSRNKNDEKYKTLKSLIIHIARPSEFQTHVFASLLKYVNN